MKRIFLAAAAALTLGAGFGAVEANAQYYGGDDYGGQRRYERRGDFDRDDRRDDRYDRRRREDRYERRGGGRGGSVCVTARGNCAYPPAPYNSSCGCEIPGFGLKRGRING